MITPRICEPPFIPTSPMTLAVIPLSWAEPGTISILHKGKRRSGSQGHTRTEHRIALGALSPMPRGLLCPDSHISTWMPWVGAGQDAVPRAGPGLPEVPTS